jgi:hypothetical protein
MSCRTEKRENWRKGRISTVGLLINIGHLVKKIVCNIKTTYSKLVSTMRSTVIRNISIDKTRVQMPAKIFPHLKLLCLLFIGSTLDFDKKQRNCSLIKFGVFYNKSKILTILFIVKYEKITFLMSF